MPRPATGQVILDPRRKTPTFAIRFRAYGKRHFVRLGTVEDGWTRRRAQTELDNILADVRRGIWRPADPEAIPEPFVEPTFHEFATSWFNDSQAEWKVKTRADYEWQLSCHLLPFFAEHRISAITIAEVDRYRRTKLAEGEAIRAAAAAGKPLTHSYIDKAGREHRRARRALSATSINKTITRLAQILELAVEYELIQSNPAKGRRRRVKARRRTPSGSTTPSTSKRCWLRRGSWIASGQTKEPAPTMVPRRIGDRCSPPFSSPVSASAS